VIKLRDTKDCAGDGKLTVNRQHPRAPLTNFDVRNVCRAGCRFKFLSISYASL